MPKKQQAPLCRLTGTVVHGKGKGHTVGMPTANLQPGPGQALPPEGVYAALAEVEGQTCRAVTNVGTRPTVDSDSRVGGIKRAAQGLFTIDDRDPNTPYIKRVRVVTSVDFFLE